jgi:hypothetical protein
MRINWLFPKFRARTTVQVADPLCIVEERVCLCPLWTVFAYGKSTQIQNSHQIVVDVCYAAQSLGSLDYVGGRAVVLLHRARHLDCEIAQAIAKQIPPSRNSTIQRPPHWTMTRHR